MKKYLLGILIIILLFGYLNQKWPDFKTSFLISSNQWEEAVKFIDQRIQHEKDEQKRGSLIVLREHIRIAMAEAALVLVNNALNTNEVNTIILEKYEIIHKENIADIQENLGDLELYSQRELLIRTCINVPKVDTWLESYRNFSEKSAHVFFRKATAGYFYISLNLEETKKIHFLSYIFYTGKYTHKGYNQLVSWIE